MGGEGLEPLLKSSEGYGILAVAVVEDVVDGLAEEVHKLPFATPDMDGLNLPKVGRSRGFCASRRGAKLGPNFQAKCVRLLSLIANFDRDPAWYIISPLYKSDAHTAHLTVPASFDKLFVTWAKSWLSEYCNYAARTVQSQRQL